VDRRELKMRLAAIGMSKVEFAQRLGVSKFTLYQWEQTPQYAVAVLELLERLNKLERK